MLLDSKMYGKTVLAPWNIVSYNILSNKGPDLYGTEPWSFYFINGTLNFNVMFAFALFSPLFLIGNWRLEENGRKKGVVVATLFLWLGVFVVQPHKVRIWLKIVKFLSFLIEF